MLSFTKMVRHAKADDHQAQLLTYRYILLYTFVYGGLFSDYLPEQSNVVQINVMLLC